ncbi:MAG: exo-alpha-sialidase [Planctomycetes bacterium]|nr:exo-alpha-sialidase [Planctomycetota bacterium]
MTSDDEGETWTAARELPASLGGDRHLARYAPDGRLVVAFRDVAKGSPTYGDFVAWVGTYDDIVKGREGQYRVLLISSPKKLDLGYPGLEVLPDGTFVATTYAVLAPGEKHAVASVRFRLEEIDARAAELPQKTDLFVAGTEGTHTFRIPALLATPKGTLLAFCEARRGSRSDTGDIDLVLRRSADGGATWGPIRIVWDDGPNTCGNPCPVVDGRTGTIHLLMTHNLGVDAESRIIAQTSEGTRTVWVSRSEDDGVTWSKPVEITAQAKRPDWTWYATGPGVGIQLESGPHAGRLAIPCDHIEAGTKRYYSHVILSDDGGSTWRIGGRTPADQVNECQIVQLVDGRLMLNMRNYDRTKTCRAVSTSGDGGESWSPLRWDEALVEPVCQASLLRYTRAPGDDRNRLIFSNPARAKAGDRNDMTVRLSYDEGATWPVAKRLHRGPAAYSCLTVLREGSPACLYEAGVAHPYEKIVFARFTLSWLTDGADQRPNPR